MLRRPAEQVVSKQEGSDDPFSDLSPLPAPVNGGWRAMGREEIARLHRLYYDPRIEVKEIARVWRVSTSTLLRWVDEMDWPSRRELTRQAAAQRLAFGREIRQAAASDAASGAAGRDAQDVAQDRDEADRRARECDALERQSLAARATFAPRPAAPNVPQRLPEHFDAQAPVDAAALIGDVERAVRRELALIEMQINDPTPGARERNARALATLVRALNGLKDLRGAQYAAMPHYGQEELRPPRDLEKLRRELEESLNRIRASGESDED